MPTPDTRRARKWTMTINNWVPEHVEILDKYFADAIYAIYGEEIGELNGTPHLQIYFSKKNPIMFSTLKKKFPTAHIEQAKGDDLQNQTYCSKDKKFKEFGTPQKQGERNDIKEIAKRIIDGEKLDDITMENPDIYHQFGRTLSRVEDIAMRKMYRKEMTSGLWIYGETGTGKSERAFENYNPETHYIWKYDNGWNDGYAQQETVIIDEFRGQMPMNELLMMIDKHPNYSVRRRGREPLPFVSKHVIITSSMHPKEIYKNLAITDKLEQLYRRIKIEQVFKE